MRGDILYTYDFKGPTSCVRLTLCRAHAGVESLKAIAAKGDQVRLVGTEEEGDSPVIACDICHSLALEQGEIEEEPCLECGARTCSPLEEYCSWECMEKNRYAAK